MVEAANERVKTKDAEQRKRARYQIVWRWHFYAGLIFSPFLIILAISGGVYLFKPQIESSLYQELYYVQEIKETTLAPSALVARAKEAFPESPVSSIRFYDDPQRTTEISMVKDGERISVYVNPYDGVVQGSLVNSEKLTEIFKKIHSELWVGGTFANRLVELAACWAVILLITGLYIWWPRNRASIWGTILPRFKKKGRVFWRDMHAVPAFWLSLFILILIATGLPWTGVMGEQINRIATSTNTGYPPYALSFRDKPESTVKTKEVADDVPWATEHITVPTSSGGQIPISLEDVTYLAETRDVNKPYTISMPEGDTGVYTIASSHTKPGDNATIHVDQYSGAILSDVRFHDYGMMAKGITIGIALHEGRLFGLPNQILGLITCLGLIGLIVSSWMMWKKRKPQGSLGAPTQVKDRKVSRAVFLIMMVMGIIMPLVGLSIIFIYFLDRFVLSKMKRLQAWYS
ncbi:PepSY-associated TM helix domain-containing protein [Halalkalibacterium halodurans]|uniref:Iron-regulated protein n=1 Tax=Halalkalibacterium halodurans TaxID=86665 RepID=A0A0M0KN09_ALKHA|nr:PepSY domain-containing protein [Halalkalibacterium halodurans]TPE67338.1 PepSY domain-containing protein [Halalkalibacterium halodurans]